MSAPTPQIHTAPGRLGATTTRVLLAVLRLHAEQLHAFVPDVAAAVGLRNKSTAWYHLEKLRAAGLVAWEAGSAGTIRPTVNAAPVTSDGVS